jgi:peptidoglycan/xylan/chitin deacetylase (PgdA/CDA1 family)
MGSSIGSMITPPRATVCLSVDFDAMSLWMNWGARGPQALSRGEFGANVGAPRLLELFDRYGIVATWFVPGHTADTYPGVTAAVAERGHEIGNHGYLHETFDLLTDDETRAVLRKGSDSLERVAGVRPRGMRLPAGDAAPAFFDILVEEGFSYDSSMNGNDFSPYWCRSGDRPSLDSAHVFGPEIDLVEFPIGFVMNDFHHFEFNYGNPLLVGHAPPSHVEEIFKSQFDYMYEHVPGGTVNVTVHPQCIGQGLRIAMFERFIRHCAGRPGTRFTNIGTVVDEFRAAQRAARGADLPRVDVSGR